VWCRYIWRRPPGPRRPGEPRLVDAFRHIKANPNLFLPIAVAGVIGTFGLNFQITIALVAVTVFHTGSAASAIFRPRSRPAASSAPCSMPRVNDLRLPDDWPPPPSPSVPWKS
jgi:hypothetical protein